ncbi:hypothetical protein V2J09_005068 [Rumex salicifolius]
MIASPNARSSSSSASVHQSSVQIRSASSSFISRNGLSLRRPHSVSHLFFKSQNASISVSPKLHFSWKPLNLVMQWQDCKVKIEVDVPTSVAYECYSDRESMPKWLPFISSVKILEDQKDLSQMYLKYDVFGQELEFSLLARNLQPIPNQKIHWRSMEGLPNRGAVRFYPKGSSSCLIEVKIFLSLAAFRLLICLRTLVVVGLQLTVSYEVPEILAPIASALRPFTEGLLLRGLESFSKFAKEYQNN